MRVDDHVNDIVDLVTACVCDEFADEPLCFCGRIAGQMAYDAMGVGGECYDDDGDPLDTSSCGQVWTRLSMAYPAQAVGQPMAIPDNCGASIGLTLELGALRCIRIEASGDPLPAEEMLEATRLQTADMLALVRAVKCCAALDGNQYILGQYTPIGPEGGVVGGVWSLSILVD